MSRKLSEYLSLLTSQYQNSPKFMEWLKVNIQVDHDISLACDNLKYAFSVDSISAGTLQADSESTIITDQGQALTATDMAKGVQLDIIGQIVGASRRLNFNPGTGLSAVLDDDTYRLLIKATIGRNNWDGLTDSLQPLWASLFPKGRMVIQDNHDMTITVILFGEFSAIIQELITHDLIVPRPQGVLINYEYGTMPFFGWDREDSFISGFDVGNWV